MNTAPADDVKIYLTDLGCHVMERVRFAPSGLPLSLDVTLSCRRRYVAGDHRRRNTTRKTDR